MDLNHYHGEPVADPGKFIRLTLRGHYVRWRLDNILARSSSARGLPTRETDGRPKSTID